MVSAVMNNFNDLAHIHKSGSVMATLDCPPLPMEAFALKESIRQTHHSKSFSFSLLHLRKMVVPPVQIPRNYKKMRTLRVSGTDVPFTRKMFELRKQELPRRFRLKTIREE